MDGVKWIKVVTDIFDNDKLKMIDAMPDRDAVIVIWFKLLCLAGKKNENGMLLFTDEIAYTNEMLANYFNRPLETVRMALKVFEKFGMIEVVDNVICLSNWEHYQNTEGMDRIREQARIRKRNQRDRERLALEDKKGRHTMSRDTSRDVTPIDKEIDKDIDIKNIGVFFEDEELNKTFSAFISYRKKMKRPLTDRAIQLAIKKLNELGKDNETRVAIIEQSILQGWVGLFPLKGDKGNRFHNFAERKDNLDSDVMDKFDGMFKERG